MTPATVIYIGPCSAATGTSDELRSKLRAEVESHGGRIEHCLIEDGPAYGRGSRAAWNVLMANLGTIRRVVIPCVGDLPGRTMADLLKVLSMLRQHGVELYVHEQGISTADGIDAALDIIAAYRKVKRSQAISRGLARAKEAGTRVGRPPVPLAIRRRIRAAVETGEGIRPTARRFRVSPGTVLNICRTDMQPRADRRVSSG